MALDTTKVQFIPRIAAAHIFEWALFCLLFFYLILRAIYVPPLHDEVATFFHYIETGDIWSDTAVLDANNHLLNSYLSRIMYLLFGENFFFLRLPNVFAFFIYFWSIVNILKGLNHRFNYFVALVALNTIPFVLEYFAMTRGYGLGMAFFTLSIALLIHWLKTQKTRVLFFCLLAGWFSVFSNLIFINSFVLLVVAVIAFIIIDRSTTTLKNAVFQVGSLLLVGVLTVPLIDFGLKLKNSGALYYGSLDGLWEVTGASLSQLVLFTANAFVKWGVIIALLVMVTEAAVRYFELKWRDFLHNYFTIVLFFLVGNIIMTWSLATFLAVNYPEDRAGIYFVLLFLIAAIYAIDKIKWKYSGIPFLFFPITLLYVINISQTVVTPDQLLRPDFYSEIRSHAADSGSVQIYPTQHLAWAYYERSQDSKIVVFNQREPSPVHDVVVTRKPFYNPEIHTEFEAVFKDSLTKNYSLLQKEALKRKKIFEKTFSFPWHANEFSEIISFEPNDSLSADSYLFNLKGEIEIDSIYNNISIIFAGSNEKGEQVSYSYFPLRWYFGARNLVFDFEMNHPISFGKNDIHALKIYLWNPRQRSFTMSNNRLEVFELR
ncbi:MAG: ArnT family glycosyltransferase [Bacteroidota bacterium]